MFKDSHADWLGNSAPLKHVPPAAAELPPRGAVGAGLFCGAEVAGLVPGHAELATIGRDRVNLAPVSKNRVCCGDLSSPRHTPSGMGSVSSNCAFWYSVEDDDSIVVEIAR